MGRAKLKMELIPKEKTRNITFKKRKDGLVQKIQELTTLCDVRACMIIYGPKQENGSIEPEIWPRDHDEVKRVIENFKSKKKDFGSKTFGLADFFNERKRKIENELSELRKRNMEPEYKFLDDWNEGQLRAFASDLGSKAELVRCKIEELKRTPSEQGVEMDITGLISQLYPHIPIYYPAVDHHYIDRNSMMMLLMNGEDQFGGAPSSNGANIQCASFNQQIHCFAPPPQLPFSGGWENHDVAWEDIVQNLVMNGDYGS
ncbi:hypothetical protein ACS0TY_000440 [Phlomoides rotata]